jgi:divalent metal cation (Fe/Co/Zn/Cd) transporter
LRTFQLGPEELLRDAKVELDPALTLAEVAQAIDEAERRVRARVPSARVSCLEPDCYRAGAQPGRLTRVQPRPPGRLLDRARRGLLMW